MNSRNLLNLNLNLNIDLKVLKSDPFGLRNGLNLPSGSQQFLEWQGRFAHFSRVFYIIYNKFQNYKKYRLIYYIDVLTIIWPQY